jgi:hypothetical protein
MSIHEHTSPAAKKLAFTQMLHSFICSGLQHNTADNLFIEVRSSDKGTPANT